MWIFVVGLFSIFFFGRRVEFKFGFYLIRGRVLGDYYGDGGRI